MTDTDDELSDRERERRAHQRRQSEKENERQRRWATRLEAMAHSRLGSTTFNSLIQGGKIVAKRQGHKILIDLDSLDEYLDALPDASAQSAA